MSAEFVTSAAAGGSDAGVPHDGLPQIALAGRSNVGKSTLINALTRRKVARTSAAPGKTRLANVYRLTVEGGGPGRWNLYLVDMPGYGYARGGADAAKELAAVAESYFASRNAGSGMRDVSTQAELAHSASRAAHPGSHVALLLVDSRHPGLESDIQAHRWLQTFGVEPVVIATKIDKLSRADRVRNLKELKRVFGTAALPVSAERGEGLDELWTRVARMVRGTKERR
ncbi:MAG: 50S ribosome-binding GTPase [Acidobacteria bacterium]|nr:50S ribosome-binding GTPase [Acidobacteriota bacterium]